MCGLTCEVPGGGFTASTVMWAAVTYFLFFVCVYSCGSGGREPGEATVVRHGGTGEFWSHTNTKLMNETLCECSWFPEDDPPTDLEPL